MQKYNLHVLLHELVFDAHIASTLVPTLS